MKILKKFLTKLKKGDSTQKFKSLQTLMYQGFASHFYVTTVKFKIITLKEKEKNQKTTKKDLFTF